MTKRKRKPGPKPKNLPEIKGQNQGRALTEVQKEAIRQTYMLTNNKAETARVHKVAYNTITNVLKEAEDPERQRARARAANELAGRVHVKADQIISSISVEDIQSGYLRDDDGQYVLDRNGRPIWLGPTLNQKVLAGAILADKLPVIESYRQQLEGNNSGVELPAPENVRALIEGIKAKIKRVKILDVEFEGSEQDRKAQELMDRAQQELDRAEEVEVVELDFDNPQE